MSPDNSVCDQDADCARYIDLCVVRVPFPCEKVKDRRSSGGLLAMKEGYWFIPLFPRERVRCATTWFNHLQETTHW